MRASEKGSARDGEAKCNKHHRSQFDDQLATIYWPTTQITAQKTLWIYEIKSSIHSPAIPPQTCSLNYTIFALFIKHLCCIIFHLNFSSIFFRPLHGSRMITVVLRVLRTIFARPPYPEQRTPWVLHFSTPHNSKNAIPFFFFSQKRRCLRAYPFILPCTIQKPACYLVAESLLLQNRVYEFSALTTQ